MARPATISTAALLLDEGPAFPSACVERAYEAVRIAGERGSDLVVLPENPDITGADQSLCPEADGICEPIPGGPITARMQELARRYRMYIVSDVREIDGGTKYNTAALIGRGGEIVGIYRKTHLAPPTEHLDVAAGDELPVFETDFGRVAIAICMDLHYEEVWKVYALKGADIICWPTQSQDYTGECTESIVNARAFDNQLHVVSAHFVQMPFVAGRCMGHARIVDPYARTLADTGHKPGVATARVDLDQLFEYWYTGEAKRNYPTRKEAHLGRRRPELYRTLTEPDTLRLWKLQHPTLSGPGPDDQGASS